MAIKKTGNRANNKKLLTKPSKPAPTQERSKRTLEAFFRVAEELIEEGSIEGATVPEIVSRANSSVGSFYARFTSKEELLEKLIERFHDTMHEKFDELFAWADGNKYDLATLAAHYVENLVESCRKNRGLLHLRFIRNLTRSNEVPREQTDKTRLLVRRMHEYFSSGLPEIKHPRPKEALDFALQMVDSVVSSRIFVTSKQLASFQPLNDQKLAEKVTRMFLSYLKQPVE